MNRIRHLDQTQYDPDMHPWTNLGHFSTSGSYSGFLVPIEMIETLISNVDVGGFSGQVAIQRTGGLVWIWQQPPKLQAGGSNPLLFAISSTHAFSVCALSSFILP